MRFIHIADVHLGMKPDRDRTWSEERHSEIKDTFYRILDLCNQEEIDFLFIAGDLFHKQPLLKELKEVNYGFSKLKVTKVIMIAGNHDYISEHSYYKGFPWCEQVYMLDSKVMDSIYFPSLNTKVYGFSYHNRDITDYRYSDVIPEEEGIINILLAHGGDEKNIPIDKNNLKQLGFDYIALGHIHKPEFITDRIAYVGSLEPLDKNEVGKHGYILGTIDKNKQIQTCFNPFAKREYIRIILEVKPTMTSGEICDYAKSYITQNGEENIYIITLKGHKDPDITIELTPIYKLGNVIQVIDETVPDYDFNELYFGNQDNMIGMFIDEIRHSGENDEITDKALYYGVEALLKARG